MSEITERLPQAAAAPLRAVLRFMRLFVAAGGMLMALTFMAVVIIRYGFSGNLFAYEEWLLAISFWTFFFGGRAGGWKEIPCECRYSGCGAGPWQAGLNPRHCCLPDRNRHWGLYRLLVLFGRGERDPGLSVVGTDDGAEDPSCFPAGCHYDRLCLHDTLKRNLFRAASN